MFLCEVTYLRSLTFLFSSCLLVIKTWLQLYVLLWTQNTYNTPTVWFYLLNYHFKQTDKTRNKTLWLWKGNNQWWTVMELQCWRLLLTFNLVESSNFLLSKTAAFLFPSQCCWILIDQKVLINGESVSSFIPWTEAQIHLQTFCKWVRIMARGICKTFARVFSFPHPS